VGIMGVSQFYGWCWFGWGGRVVGWACGSGRFLVFLFVCLPACFYIYDSMIERFLWVVYSPHDGCMYVYPLITHDCIDPALYTTR
jgi:hypothetical protein